MGPSPRVKNRLTFPDLRAVSPGCWPDAKGDRLLLLTLVNHFTRSRSVAAMLRSDARWPPRAFLGTVVCFAASEQKGDVYNILWVVVFGFATLNSLSLVVKRFEPRHN